MHWFTILLYQPLLNILVFLYWGLGILQQTSAPDMGIAVILLTLVVRVILLPLSLAGDKSEDERRKISAKIVEIQAEHVAEPVMSKKHSRQVLMESNSVIISELINLFIQVSISLMLWRIFARGLVGEDLHLVYQFMPKVETPFNLMFLGKYDLSHPHMILNILQSVMIFILETVSLMTSPYKHTRSDAVRLQLVLPIVSFLIFMFLPAGKKLFVITTLGFSIVLTIVKAVRRSFLNYKAKVEAKEESHAAPAEEKIVVEVK